MNNKSNPEYGIHPNKIIRANGLNNFTVNGSGWLFHLYVEKTGSSSGGWNSIDTYIDNVNYGQTSFIYKYQEMVSEYGSTSYKHLYHGTFSSETGLTDYSCRTYILESPIRFESGIKVTGSRAKVYAIYTLDDTEG